MASLLYLTLVWACFLRLAGCQFLSRVLEVRGRYFYDRTVEFCNKTFQIEYHGLGQGMGRDWMLASSSSWGRTTAGAGVRLKKTGEVVRGKPCGTDLCLQSAQTPFYHLNTVQDSRVQWDRLDASTAQTTKFRIFCDQTAFQAGTRCQIVSRRNNDNTILLRVYDIFVVWCSMDSCWHSDINSHWTFKRTAL